MCSSHLLVIMSLYSVQFVGHVIQDEFTEYHMKVVSSPDGNSWLVRRRYREFRELHDHLKLKYPDRIPPVPGKKLWGNQDPNFVRDRETQLQVYMDGVLAVEPDCRTRVLQRFLEIKKTTSPVVAPSPPQIAQSSSNVSAAAPPPQRHVSLPAVSKESQEAIIADLLENKIFDLSLSPSLLDSTEYIARKKKFDSILAAAKPGVLSVVPAGPSDLNDPFEAAAWSCEDNGLARAAINSVLGKGPIACENDLVAFFDISPIVPLTTSSSSHHE